MDFPAILVYEPILKARGMIMKTRRFILFSSILTLTGVSAVGSAQDRISLAGKWRFGLDRDDSGIREQWYNTRLPEEAALPGCLTEQGIGDEVSLDTKWIGDIVDPSFFTAPEYEAYRKPGGIKIPFWLQPDRYYAGPAWYQRDLLIPEAWRGRHITLFLERAHWRTSVWVDGKPMGGCDGLAAPHEYDLSGALTPGMHVLTLCVDNRLILDIGVNSHSISDHTQGNWNGIVGRLELRATHPVWIESLRVFPHVGSGSVTVNGRIGNLTGKSGKGGVLLHITPGPVTGRTGASWDSGGGEFQMELRLGAFAKTWDEFNPAVFRAAAAIEGMTDSAAVNFGMREISTLNTQFMLNGKKIFIRGTLECAIFPRTGYPPTDVDSWKQVIRAAKAHGLNSIRFHSWCPPEAAFAAADELGFYLYVECSSWANGSSSLGDGKPVDRWIYEEADRILNAYGNHPSFLLMSYGNEPGGERCESYLAAWVRHFKAADPRRLYTSGAGWPELSENQFHITPEPRIQYWGAGLTSRINSRPPETCTDYAESIRARTVPVISHEIGQWCVYPDFDEIPKYTGYLKPKNFEIFRDRLRENGMKDRARDFLFASGRLQTLCYKEEIESALRTAGMGGFQLLDLHDFPGQGTALVGVLDPFWEPKGYVAPEEFRRFCGSTVLLARLAGRVFVSDDTLDAAIEISHFGPEPMRDAVARWKLLDISGNTAAAGSFPGRDVPVDNGTFLGRVRVGLKSLLAPARYKLVAGLEGTGFENDWDIWVYPDRNEIRTGDVAVVHELNDTALAKLERGGKVLLEIPQSRVRPDGRTGKVELGFSTIFWNTAWTQRQAPHTLGILCDPGHPAFAEFPTGKSSDWQWWYLVTRAGAMILDGFPAGLKPLIHVIDDWFTARRLALAFEAAVGNGRLLAVSIDLEGERSGNPVAGQLEHSLLRYMARADFDPKVRLSAEMIRGLMTR